MPVTEPIEIPIEGNPSDFIADAKKVQEQMDFLKYRLEKAGVSQAAYNKAVANARPAMNQQVEAVKKASISITDLRSAYMIAADAARVAGQVWQATGQEFVNYAEQVKNMSRALGASAEETSRIIQVADDVRISYDSLKVAMKEAQKDGVQPNIEGLAKLADQYKAIQSPTERTKFLLDKFGKSGLEMGKLMEKGGDGIRSMSGAIDDSLIMTDKGIKASDDYQKSLDDLNDSFLALKISVGEKFVPIMNDSLKVINANITAFLTFGDVLEGKVKLNDWAAGLINANNVIDDTSALLDNSTTSFEDNTGAVGDNANALDGQKEAVDAAKQALDDYKTALENVSQANLDMEGMSRDIAKSQKQYAEDHAQAAATLSKAITEGDAEGIANARKDIQDLEATWHESANNMIYDMVLVGLSAGGLLDSEQKALDEYAVKAGIKTQADIDEANRRREVADSTINGILQSEDVLAEQRRVDAETLRLTEAQASAEKLAAAGNEAAAMGQVSAATQKEIELQMILAAKARNTAIQYSNIKMVGPNVTPYKAKSGSSGGKSPDERDSGGAGIAGTPYMIGTGAQPEMFIPNTNGTFIPNADKKGALGGVTYNIVINNPKRETAENSIRSSLKNLIYTGSAA